MNRFVQVVFTGAQIIVVNGDQSIVIKENESV